MPAVLDLIYVALFAVAWPFYDYFIDWRTFQRWLREKPLRARVHEYWRIICQQWLIVAVGIVLWQQAGRPWSALGLQVPDGLRLWALVGTVALLAALYVYQAATLARGLRARAHVRERLAKTSLAEILPHTTEEFVWFVIVSLTAGVCEEFLFRGYFIWALAPWLGWWGAAALGVPIFGLMHAYQGRSGVIRTAIMGAVMTIVVALIHSIIPAMALHALVDIGSGLVVWIAQREVSPQGDALET